MLIVLFIPLFFSGLNQHLQPKPLQRQVRDEKASAFQRLGDVLSQVEAVKESVQKVALGMPGRSKDDRPARADSKYSFDADALPAEERDRENAKRREDGSSKGQEKERGDEEETAGDDDLQSTIETWLSKQKRGVTARRKKWQQPSSDRFSLMDGRIINSISNSNMDPSEGTVPTAAEHEHIAEELLDFPAAAAVNATAAAREVEEEDFDNDPFDEDFGDGDGDGEVEDEVAGATARATVDHGRGGRGVYMGNDVEVVGLQCMLAKALMGDDDDDEVDETNEKEFKAG